jgi:hypothetical protein
MDPDGTMTRQISPYGHHFVRIYLEMLRGSHAFVASEPDIFAVSCSAGEPRGAFPHFVIASLQAQTSLVSKKLNANPSPSVSKTENPEPRTLKRISPNRHMLTVDLHGMTKLSVRMIVPRLCMAVKHAGLMRLIVGQGHNSIAGPQIPRVALLMLHAMGWEATVAGGSIIAHQAPIRSDEMAIVPKGEGGERSSFWVPCSEIGKMQEHPQETWLEGTAFGNTVDCDASA